MHSLGGAPLAVAAAKCQIVLAQGWARCWCFVFIPSADFSLKANCFPRLFLTHHRQLVWQPLEWFGFARQVRKLEKFSCSPHHKGVKNKVCAKSWLNAQFASTPFILLKTTPRERPYWLPFFSRGNWGSERLSFSQSHKAIKWWLKILWLFLLLCAEGEEFKLERGQGHRESWDSLWVFHRWETPVRKELELDPIQTLTSHTQVICLHFSFCSWVRSKDNR